jgi:hypothetical protein
MASLRSSFITYFNSLDDELKSGLSLDDYITLFHLNDNDNEDTKQYFSYL